MTPLRGVRRALLVAVLGAAALAMSACSAQPTSAPVGSETGSPRPSESRSASVAPAPTASADAPRVLAVIGDSNSTGFSGTLEAGLANGSAWAAQLPSDDFAVVGGWAVDGSTTARMADAATAIEGVDVVIIMGGTNDLAAGVPTESILDSISQIGGTMAAPVTVVSAIAPLNWAPAQAQELNAALADFARASGWLFVDPWVEVRAPEGTWADAYLTDGVHTSPEGYGSAALQIDAQLRDLLP